MVDVSKTIAAKSDQLNADDLIDSPITVRITKVSANPGSDTQPIAINYEGDKGKPYLPCKSMRRVLVHIWGKDGAAYVGRSVSLYRDGAVQFGGIAVGGIRISHMSHIDGAVTIALAVSRGSRKPTIIKPLEIQPSGDPPQDDPALKWAKSFVSMVIRCENIGAIDILVKSKAAKIEELREKRPDLYDKVLYEIDATKETLTPKVSEPASDGDENF